MAMNHLFWYNLSKYEWISLDNIADNSNLKLNILEGIIRNNTIKGLQINGQKLYQVESLLQAIENYFYHT